MKKLLGILGSISLIAGLWAFIHFVPVTPNIQLAEAASQIYPKDSTSFIQIPFIFRGSSVKDTNLTTPPGNPAEGDRYIVGSVATDTWAGKENYIAEWHARSGSTAQWYFYDPQVGYQSFCNGDSILYVYNGASWVTFSTIAGTVNHASLSNLSYATAGHTGFEPTVTKGNLSTTTAGITIGGGTGAVIGSGATVNIATASNSDSGLLSNTNWSTFYNKQSALTFIYPIVNSGGNVSMQAATTTDSGYLSTANWNTFNGAASHKATEDALNGIVKVNGAGNYSTVADSSGNWNSAYSWGNHASAGYFTMPVGAAQGDLLYYDTSGWCLLPPGTTGWFLKTQGAAANPTWAAITGGGDMLVANYAAHSGTIVDNAYQLVLAGMAAGDVLYVDSDLKVHRLAKDIGKWLKSGSNAPLWDTPAGSGDMDKATYDTNSNNIVDKAEMLDDGSGDTATAVQVKAAVKNTPTDAQIVLWDNTGADSMKLGGKTLDQTGLDTGKIPKYSTDAGGKWVMSDDVSGGGGGTTYTATPPLTITNGVIGGAESIYTNIIYPVKTWSNMTSLPSPTRYSNTGAVCNGLFYSIGGYNGVATIYNDIDVYNPVTNSWASLTNMPVGMRAGCAVTVDTGIYYFADSDLNDTTYMYNVSSDVWITKARMPVTISLAGATNVNGVIYSVGGRINNAWPPSSCFLKYDTSLDSWITETAYPDTVCMLCATSYNNQLWVAGGTGTGGYLGTVRMYDPNTQIWTTKASMPSVRVLGFFCAIGSKLYYVGGTIDGTNADSSVFEYDVANNTWATVTSMPEKRAEFAGGVIGQSIYTAGGYISGTTPTGDVRKFVRGYLGEKY